MMEEECPGYIEFHKDAGYDESHEWMDVWDVERMVLLEENVPWDELGFMAGRRRAELGQYEANEVDVVSTDGTLYATMPSSEPLISIKKSSTNELVAISPEKHSFRANSFSPDGTMLYVDDHDGRGYIWKYLENRMVPLENDDKYSGGRKIFSVDNKVIAGIIISQYWPKHHFVVWNTVSGERVVDIELPEVPSGYIPRLQASTPGGEFIVDLSTKDGIKLRIFNVEERVLQPFHLEMGFDPIVMLFSPLGNTIVTIDGYKTLAFWEWKHPH